jgi:hypothetical protein
MPTLLRNRYCFLALSYSILEAARHPSQGGSAAFTDEQQNVISVAAITADDHAAAAPLLCVTNLRRFIGSFLKIDSSLSCRSMKAVLCVTRIWSADERHREVESKLVAAFGGKSKKW